MLNLEVNKKKRKMKIKIRNLFITSIILKLTEAQYGYNINYAVNPVNPYRHPYSPPNLLNNSDNENCFQIGENRNNYSECLEFEGYYIPKTVGYSDYTSFAEWLRNKGNSDTNNFLSMCTGDTSYIRKNNVEMYCNYVIYDTFLKNRCTSKNQGKSFKSAMCRSDCNTYLNQIQTSCKYSGKYGLETACSSFKSCEEDESGSVKITITEPSNDNKEDDVKKESSEKDDNKEAKKEVNEKPEDSNQTEDKKSGKQNGSSSRISFGKVENKDDDMKNKPDNVSESSGNKNHISKNILYTIGFMVPLSLFIGFGFIYYRKKFNKVIDFEKGSFSYHLSSHSGHSGIQTYNSEHSLSSNSNYNVSSHNKIFSIGLTDPKSISTMNIPIKNIDTREQDNMASNCVAELISTATMINAANNANNNIQPITPNEVNININTTLHYNTLSSHTSSPKQCTSSYNSPENSFNSNNSNSSLKRKFSPYTVNDEKRAISLNSNGQRNSSMKHNYSTQINTLSPSSPDLDSTPIVDLSMYDNKPLLHIKKTNSFYHSSVSSEMKKYNSFIAPISPIMSENTLENNGYSADKMKNEKDGQTNKYTNHLSANSEIEYEEDEDSNIEEEEEDMQSEEENIDNKSVSIINNNGVSILKTDHHSSKYNSAKIPLSVMTVVQEFEPRMEDELKLKVNDRILLLKVFDDGWAVGLNQMTGRQGVFPMEYVVSSELIKSKNKFASQVEFRNALPNRTHSQAFSNFSFTSTTMNDSIIRLSDSDFDINFANKSQSVVSSKYYPKNSIIGNLRKSKLNNSSVIEE